MAERSYQVLPVGIEYVCDKCSYGTMKPNGTILTSLPPKYGHECDNCSASEYFTKQYPYVEFVKLRVDD